MASSGVMPSSAYLTLASSLPSGMLSVSKTRKPGVPLSACAIGHLSVGLREAIPAAEVRGAPALWTYGNRNPGQVQPSRTERCEPSSLMPRRAFHRAEQAIDVAWVAQDSDGKLAQLVV